MTSGFSGLAVGAFLLALSAVGTAQAAPITKSLTVQVYQLCNDFGSSCASLGPSGNSFFSTETNKIWEQAGISVSFNLVGQINDSDFTDLDDNDGISNFSRLTGTYGATTPGNLIVDMFLVHTIAGGVFGEAKDGVGDIAIAMDDVLSFNGGIGRLDTIAHELGHNLGLVPLSLGGDSDGHSAASNELMASGGNRSIASSTNDIAPSGLGLDYLPANQIAYARQSALLQDVAPVPEPGEWAMMMGGLGLTAAAARRRKRAALAA